MDYMDYNIQRASLVWVDVCAQRSRGKAWQVYISSAAETSPWPHDKAEPYQIINTLFHKKNIWWIHFKDILMSLKWAGVSSWTFCIEVCVPCFRREMNSCILPRQCAVAMCRLFLRLGHRKSNGSSFWSRTNVACADSIERQQCVVNAHCLLVNTKPKARMHGWSILTEEDEEELWEVRLWKSLIRVSISAVPQRGVVCR